MVIKKKKKMQMKQLNERERERERGKKPQKVVFKHHLHQQAHQQCTSKSQKR